MRDLYEVLGIDRDATPQQVRKAYRKKIAKNHPDVGGSRQAYDEIALAHEVLMDPMRRVQYDATGELGEREADNVVSELMGTLAQVLDQVLEEVERRGLEAERQDLIQLMILCAKSAETETEKQIPALEEVRDALQKLAVRFEVVDDDTPNHFKTILLQRVTTLNEKIKPIKSAVANLRAAKLYLQGCRFKKVEPAFLGGNGIYIKL